MTATTPDTFSAAVTARIVSRRLRKAGVVMSKTTGKRMSEGVYVHRIGYSGTVVVSYHLCVKTFGRPTDEERARRDEAMSRAAAMLAEWGYVAGTPNGWKIGLYIACAGE